MKKIRWKTFLIAGLIIAFGSPTFFSWISAFQNMPNKFRILTLSCYFCLGVVMFIFSLTKKRMEDGEVRADNLFRALTPAQICLLVSLVVFTLSAIFEAFVAVLAGDFWWTCGMIGVLVSGILTISGAASKYTEKQQKSVTTVENRPKEHCEQCGAAANIRTYQTLNGRKLCSACARKMLEEAEGGFYPKANCRICRQEYNKSEMILVDDRFICNRCFRSRYPESTPQEEDLFLNL